MLLKSKTASLLFLGITALIFSRTTFGFFDDPEGPNLLIVVALAGFLYVLSLVPYSSVSTSALKRVLLAIAVQILVAVCLYFFLR